MSHDLDYPPIPRPALRRRWFTTSLVLWLISSIAYAFLLGPLLETLSLTQHSTFLPADFWAPVGMFIPSLALGLLSSINTLSPLPKRILFRPTRARILGALGFWLILPIAAVSLVPVSAGYVAISIFSEFGVNFDWSGLVLAIMGLFLGLSYVIACLLSSGIPHRWQRALAYILIWSGCYWITFSVGTAQQFVL